MLAIAIGGQRLGSGMKVVRTHAAAARKVAGVVVAVTALAIALGVDQRFTTSVPGYTAALQKRIEQTPSARKELDRLSGQAGSAPASSNQLAAPDFRGIDLWLNTPNGRPLSLAKLRGRSCSSTSGRTRASTASARCRTSKRGIAPTGRRGSRSSASIAPSSRSSTCPATSARRCTGSAFVTRSRSTTPSRRGAPTPTTTGPPSTSSTARATSATSTTARGRTARPSGSSVGCSARRRAWRARRSRTRRRRSSRRRVLPRICAPRSLRQRTADPRHGGALPLPAAPPPGRAGLCGHLDGRAVAHRGRSGRSAAPTLPGQERLPRARRERHRGRPRRPAADLRTVHVSGTPRLYTRRRFPRPTRGLLELRVSPNVAGYAFTFG